MAYKIPSKSFKVELTSPEGTAIFKFKLPLWTRILDAFDTSTQATPEKIKNDWSAIVNDIESIEGLEDPDGAPLSKEDILAGLDFVTMKALVTAYNTALAQLTFVDQEKKESSAE